MKTIMASVLAAGALAAAGAASAQTSLDDRMDRIEARIDQGVDEGTLSARQADLLRGQLWSVRTRRDRLDNAGLLNTWRRQDLSSRLDRIAYEVSRDRYFARYGTFRGYRQEWDWGEQGPYEAPAIQAQPYQGQGGYQGGQPNQVQPYQGQGGYQGYYYQGQPNYQVQPNQAQPYQGQGGYQGYNYQAQPYPGRNYQGRPDQGGYQGYYYQGQPNYPAQPYQGQGGYDQGQPYQGSYQGYYYQGQPDQEGYYGQAPDQGDDEGGGG